MRAVVVLWPDEWASSWFGDMAAARAGHAGAHRAFTMNGRRSVVASVDDAHVEPLGDGGARIECPRTKVSKIVMGPPQ